MYRTKSNQSGDISQLAVQLDLAKRGWITNIPQSRDSVYDLWVDLGDPTPARVQVKTMSGNSISRIIDRSGEVVSKNGKTRNSLDYAKEGIEWLAGYDSKTGEIHYYHIDNYSKIGPKSFSVKKWPSDDFPTNPL
jgi:hypothetical protein